MGTHDDAIQLDRDDIEEGLNAAAAIGDDRMQRMAGGRVSPERFTQVRRRSASNGSGAGSSPAGQKAATRSDGDDEGRRLSSLQKRPEDW